MTVYGEPDIVDADEPTAVPSPTEPYGYAKGNDIIVVGAPGNQVDLAWFRQIAPDGEILDERAPMGDVDWGD